MKSSLLSRILVSTLLPAVAVMLVITATIQSIISMSDANHMRDAVRLETAQFPEQISAKLNTLNTLLGNIAEGMSSVRFDQPESKESAEGLLRTLYTSSSDVYSAWFAFEPNVFLSDNTRYYESLVRTRTGGVVTSHSINEKTLSNPTLSPWYYRPLLTGEPYSFLHGRYNYLIGEDDVYIFCIVRPVIRDMQCIGVVGIDILYEDLMNAGFSISGGSPDKNTLLISGAGDVLYDDDTENIGKHIVELGFSDYAPLVRTIMDGTTWIDKIRSPFSGEDTLAVLYPFQLRGTDETIYLYRETEPQNIYSAFNPSMDIVYMTVLFGSVLLMFSIYFTTRGIIKPIRQITDSFQLVVAADNESALSDKLIPVTNTGILELQILQDALVAMMVHLHEVHDLKIMSIEADIEKEKLIASAEAKSNFFAAMSHEIRTPMNAIIGISDIILHEGGLDDQQERHISDIKTSSEALLGIINDIMDISKMETRKMALYSTHYNFRALIDNVASLASHLANESGLEFKLDIAQELPLCLFGDSVRLRQVLLNLLGNAAKYTKKGFVCMHVLIKEDSMRFDITDSGVGIKEEDLPNIFEPFTRIDTRRNRETKGTGLGLSIAKNLTEMMGGEIFVTSDYGVGSTFSVELPLVLGDETKLQQESPLTGIKYSPDLHVLIVDDNEINLRVSSGLLKNLHGIDCDTANSGMEAIAMVQQQDYDLIFMDHMMPELDGVDTTRHIRSLGAKYKSLPIIALTANAVIGTREELLAAGLNDFVPKPIQQKRLQDALYVWAPVEKRISDGSVPPMSMTVAPPITPSTLRSNGTEETEHYQRPARTMVSAKVIALQSVQNINPRIGLENIGYDEEMYLQSLELFTQKLPQTLGNLNRYLKEENARDFEIVVHGIKGALSSIGAKALAETALELEKAAAGKDLDFCRKHMADYEARLMLFHDELNKVLTSEPMPQPEPPLKAAKNEITRRDLVSFRNVLESYDYEAIIAELKALRAMSCDERQGEVLLQVKELVDMFDYIAAKILIEDELL